MASGLTVRVETKGPLFNPAKTLPAISAAVDRALLDIGSRGERLVKDRTPIGASMAAVGLQGSIFHELRGTPPMRGVMVTHGKPYGDMVELGRRPGRRPPLAPILVWVRGKVGLDGPAAVRFALYVQRKIGRTGYTGFFMFQRALPAIEAFARRRVRDLTAEIARIMGGR